MTQRMYAMPASVSDWLTSTSALHWLVRDGEMSRRNDHLALEALVRSGDYFSELATRLETLAHTTPEASPELERIVSELAYLENRYCITNK